MEGGFLYQALIYLGAAVVAVPIAKKLGFGSVLGYLLAGILIGPFLLGLVGDEGTDILHFAEFGVVMMLFVVGLELKPSLLWSLRSSILGMGGLQVGITTVVLSFIIGYSFELVWQQALALGLTLALSSTAIVIQTLTEKGWMKSEGGKNIFSILLFQDIAVIPILALLPFLATMEANHIIDPHATVPWTDGLPVLGQTAVIIVAMIAVVTIGKYVLGYVFCIIAQTNVRELFTAAALLLVVAVALLMTKVGLSPALGTFIAGVVLAQNEFRHELESDIQPFKGLLLGLFFIAVGASIDFEMIGEKPVLLLSLALGLMVVKFVILYVVGLIFKLKVDNNLLLAFVMAQGGEFAFVLLSYGVTNGVMSPTVVDHVMAVVAVSMGLTPLFIIYYEKVLRPHVGTREKIDRESDTIQEKNRVIIAGFGRFGSTIGRFLQANGLQATYLDIDPNNVDLLRELGLNVYYGDASRPDLLHAAGAEEADLLLIAVDDAEKAVEIAEVAKKHFPHLKVMARSMGWENSYQLFDNDVKYVFREYLDSSLRMGAEALHCLGFCNYQVYRSMKKFRKYDDASVVEMSKMRHEAHSLLEKSKERIRNLELILLEDLRLEGKDKDLGWDSRSIKEEYKDVE